MVNELGLDIALIEDENKLRTMLQQTEDFSKKREIRMRMSELRVKRLKELYTTGEMIQTETTSKDSSTRTQTECITNKGFMTMETIEIGYFPTEDSQPKTNTNFPVKEVRLKEKYIVKGRTIISSTSTIIPQDRSPKPEVKPKEKSSRFGQPYCSVSDEVSLARYSNLVSEPEDVSDYRLQTNRYDIVKDLDEETTVKVADRVLKFFNNVHKQNEEKTTKIVKSHQTVKKVKHIFESIANGHLEKTDKNDEKCDSKIIHIENHDSPNNTNTHIPISTRTIPGAASYKSIKNFFENRKLNGNTEKSINLTPKLIRPSSIKYHLGSFEVNNDKKIQLQDITNIEKRTTSVTKSRSPDRITESPTIIMNTEIFGVKVEDINKSRRPSGLKTMKDKKAIFEKNVVAERPAREYKINQRNESPSSVMNTGRLSEIHTKSIVISDNTSENLLNRASYKSRKDLFEYKKVNDNTEKSINLTPKLIIRPSSIKDRIASFEVSNDKKILLQDKTNIEKRTTHRRVTSPNRSKRRPEKTENINSINVVSASTSETVSSKRPGKKFTRTLEWSMFKSHTTNDEIKNLLELTLEKAVGYDRRSEIISQIRRVKHQLRPSKSEKDTTNATTRVSKTVRDGLPQKSHSTPNSNSRSHSPQKATTRSFEESRSMLPQKTARQTEKARPSLPQKIVQRVEKVRSPPPL